MKHFYFLLLLLTANQLRAADTVRICTWNLLNYSETNEDGRTPMYKRILDEINPDILITQEVADAVSANRLLSALGSEWQASPFNDGPDTDNMIYFRSSQFKLESVDQLTTSLRNITQYILTVKNHLDTFYIYGLHLKAGDTQSDINSRDREAQVLQERLLSLQLWTNTYRRVFAAGDFNFYSDYEPGYQRLARSIGHELDDIMGYWYRDDNRYARVYTQSTRTAADGACGGGVGGGMDDRFDMILFPTRLSDGFNGYISISTYKVFGNDSLVRLNSPINDPPNTSVSADISADLRCASDHLPVYIDVTFGQSTSVLEEFASTGFRIYPMPVTEESVIELSVPADQISIMDIFGREVYSMTVNGRSRMPVPKLVPGVYGCRIGGAITLFIAK